MKKVWFALLVAFAALNVYAMIRGEYLVGFWSYLTTMGPWGLLLAVDLVIALGIALHLIARDAHNKGISLTPYILITLCTGSIGVLLYLIRHMSGKASVKHTSTVDAPMPT